jgi:hypothetical protein
VNRSQAETGSDPLAVAAAIGPFFAVERWQAAQGWRPLRRLADDPLVLRERVGSARSVIAAMSGVPVGDLEPRVVASTVFLGLSARLVAPAFGASVLAGTGVGYSLADLWWQPVAGGPWPLALSSRATVAAGAGRSVERVATDLTQMIVLDLLSPILTAFAETFRLSRRVLWGNVASGLGGALTMVVAARPKLGDRAAALVEAILGLPPLRATADLVAPEPDHPRRFLVRRSCCLFYRIPGGGTCADCVLNGRAAT